MAASAKKAPLPGAQLRAAIEGADLDELRERAASCRACPLWEHATQTVFGEGPRGATLMLIGEQPGDTEDKAGHPFVGPAGRVLDRALERAGIDRARVYVTNVVKHFKWEARGKRRMHSKPIGREIDACRFWLDAEIDRVKPRAIACMGATAAQALLGRGFKVTEMHGVPVDSPLAPIVVATVHPSSILRQRDDASREAAFESFAADLANVAKLLRRGDVAA